MELFNKARIIRLRSHHNKYLFAEEDEESVRQDRNGTSRNAKWTVEFIFSAVQAVRLKSCYGRYLTASNVPFLFGVTGRKVLQTIPTKLDSSVEWEAIRDGFQIKLKTRYANFLRANGGPPPWRNSVTHDIPHRTATQDWILWDVDIVDVQPDSPPRPPLEAESSSPSSKESVANHDFDGHDDETPSSLARLESMPSLTSSLPRTDGRLIYFAVGDNDGNVNDGLEWPSFTFKGTDLHELTHKLEEETGLSEIIVCSHNPLNGRLYPLRLQLPPNNTTMHVVIVPASSKLAKSFG
ncbi:uncharacterized protein LOC18432573 [Amborella trichopoda]|uniref:uncharacterized protein LOC18432573 n=1 Tax=Amborella trichopoda TaxID=13333 RepID=UPI0005D3F7FB|nr:uncharacterized protein LOC18432573 [Amborella trichopoda]XP_011622771.1 uncharacterized protein LOC18432573 [Amborella trichopoda]|eukprot:XP_006842733.2 uncharacterized protein LOC18432573 [Amborella trichopoda]